MFSNEKKGKEKAKKPLDVAKQANEKVKGAMETVGDEELEKVSGAGDPFASHPRVSTKPINDSVRKKG